MAETHCKTSPGLRLARCWYLVGALLLLGVGAASLLPPPADLGVDDKLSHLLTYFVLGAWFALLAANRRLLAWSVVGLLLYGLLLELLQGLTDYRYAEWADLAANGAGIGAGAVVFFTPLRRWFGAVDRRLAGLWRD